ncbi:MAG: type 2 periplasmic-binding domain-containing protein [Eubacteriales bacterium]
MKMKFRKFIVLLLSLFNIIMFISCSENTAADLSESDTVADTETADTSPQLTDNLPDLDFGGFEFLILAPDIYAGLSLVTEQNGEVLNDAIYANTRLVEDRFHVVLNEEPMDFWKQDSIVKSYVLSGDSTYTAITMHDRYAYAAVTQGYFRSIGELNYIDLTKEYWGGEFSRQFSVAGNLYFAFSSFNLSSYNQTHALYFNKRILNDFSLPDPYKMVTDGNWTFDEFSQMCIAVTSDVNGDGIYSEGDRFGITTVSKMLSPAFWIAEGELSVKKDGEDIPYFALPGNEKFITILENLHSLCRNDNVFIEYDEKSSNQFIAGNVLFNASMFKTASELRDMTDDFGMLPFPKYNEEQEGYRSRTLDCMFTMIPVTVHDTEMTGCVLEGLCSSAYTYVIPEYYETCLKVKYTRDEQSAEIIDLIFKGRTFDIGEVIFFSDIGDEEFNKQFKKETLDLSSFIAAKEKKMTSNLEKMTDIFTGKNN